MKVYELMAELKDMPAGAEVEFVALATVEEFTQGGVSDTDSGKALYEFRQEVKEVEEADGIRVFLYS